MSQELSGGKGVYIGTASPDDMDAVGYEEHEYVAAGTATSYQAEGEQAKDGQWTFAPDDSAEYRTRIIVRTPKKQAKFSGTVVVEWLNVSGGVDAEPEWSNLQEEVTRSGDVWVGVSAQLIGVEGGPVAVKVEGVPGAEQAGMGLKKIDPARYGSLEHPGDGYSFDIYTQVGRALRAGDALGGLEPERIIAAGQSQSAFAMVTYYNGVQPLTNAFDALLRPQPGRRQPAARRAGQGGRHRRLARRPGRRSSAPTRTRRSWTSRPRATSPASSSSVRRPPGRQRHVPPVGGGRHRPTPTSTRSARRSSTSTAACRSTTDRCTSWPRPSYRALKTWMTSGEPPASAPRLDVTVEAGKPAIERDADGIALGGIRTPPVDVPVAALSGEPGPNPAVICILLGSTKPFSEARIAQLYPSGTEYEKEYDASTRATIKAGYALEGGPQGPPRLRRPRPSVAGSTVAG